MIRRLLTLSALFSCMPLLADDAPLQLRVLSFNIRYINSGDTGARTWLARRDLASQVIREDKADLIGLQEAFRTMLDDIRVRVPGYEEVGVGREDGKEVGEYAAILVRKDRFEVLESGTFWLSDTPDVCASCSWKNVVTRVCTWAKLKERQTGKVIHFYNTHLDHESQEAREKGFALIMDHLAKRRNNGEPFVITGDLNAAEDNPAFDHLKSGPLPVVDAWREKNPSVPLAESGTMSLFTGKRDTGKIDYIFIPAGTRVIDSEIVHRNRDGLYPSDHYPVRATVEFSK
ncbi:MAG: endonuclease/exonuclease/phosphatase family protein [Verrucomicrobiaceae bacterium]|nr:MAG: endonuclease/exonuclease/phosphatase family protein [Verrucomicrobiaceae bacterium]